MSLLRTAAKVAFSALDLLFPTPNGPRVLIYHQIGAGSNRQTDMGIADFEWQLDWLADNRDVVDLETAVASWNDPDSERLTVLTFDDGYRDVYTTAFPKLQARSMPFTLYLATGMMKEANSSIHSGGDGLLTWDMVREMQASGLAEVGAHTHNHRDLRKIDSAEIESELAASDDLIITHTGVAPRHFAYPWGYWSPQADPLVQERYQTAVLGAPVRREPELLPHRIHRFPIQLSDGRLFFKRRLSGGLIPEELVRRRLRGYRGP